MSANFWLDVLSVDELPVDDVVSVTAGEIDLALYRIGSDLFATDNRCTHGAARLCDGFLSGHEIECPLHQGRFDVRSGKATCEPAVDSLRTYAVKIEGSRVYVKVS
jgi:naphthalene 1,2-dioxygenase ferredoxin component